MESQLNSKVSAKPDIYSYLDFREFFRDWINYKKSRNAQLSLAVYARKLGMTGSMLALILRGKRKLQDPSIEVLAEICGLTSSESLFLHHLIKWNQCDDPVIKNLLWEMLRPTLSNDKYVICEIQKQSILEFWFSLSLLELIRTPTFKPELEWIVGHYMGRVKVDEIKRSLLVLQELGFIEIANDKIHVIEDSILVARGLSQNLIDTYHSRNLELSIDSITNITPSRRDFSSTSIALSHDKFEIVKKKLKELREFVTELSASESNPEKVYQINVQFFPLDAEGESQRD